MSGGIPHDKVEHDAQCPRNSGKQLVNISSGCFPCMACMQDVDSQQDMCSYVVLVQLAGSAGMQGAHTHLKLCTGRLLHTMIGTDEPNKG